MKRKSNRGAGRQTRLADQAGRPGWQTRQTRQTRPGRGRVRARARAREDRIANK